MGKGSIITIIKLGRRKAYFDLEVRRRCYEAGVGDLVIVQGKEKGRAKLWWGLGRTGVLKIKSIKCGQSDQLSNSLAFGGNPGCLVLREIFQSPCCGGGLGAGAVSQSLPCMFSLPED